MRRLLAVLVVTLVGVSAIVAQQQRRTVRPRPSPYTHAAESAIKQAIAQLGNEKKGFERDLQVLGHIRGAVAALADDMQPSVALQKAYEEINEAHRLNTDFTVQQGLLRVIPELGNARRSPGIADLPRLGMLIRTHALGPSSRLVVRNALRLQDETTAWLMVQEQIAGHLRHLNEITGESLRASDEER